MTKPSSSRKLLLPLVPAYRLALLLRVHDLVREELLEDGTARWDALPPPAFSRLPFRNPSEPHHQATIVWAGHGAKARVGQHFLDLPVHLDQFFFSHDKSPRM